MLQTVEFYCKGVDFLASGGVLLQMCGFSCKWGFYYKAGLDGEEKVMSETLLKLLAEELTSIRITCPNKDCGAVIEMALKKLPDNFDGYSCPVCRQAFIPAGADRHADHIKSFAKSLQGLAGLKKVRIEIVVPTKDEGE